MKAITREAWRAQVWRGMYRMGKDVHIWEKTERQIKALHYGQLVYNKVD